MKKNIFVTIILCSFIILTGCENKEIKIVYEDITKDVIVVMDYTNIEKMLKDLNENIDLTGKNAKIRVENVEYIDKGIIIKTNNIDFIYEQKKEYISGDILYFKILNKGEKIEEKWKIKIDVIKENLMERETSFKDNVEHVEQNEEQQIIMSTESSEYNLIDYNKVKESFEKQGFSNIKFEEKITNDINYENNAVISVTINGREFKKDDKFKKDDEVIIKYWKYEEKKLDTIVLPKPDSKLGKDLDEETGDSENTKYYINVDGKSNVPVLKHYENATITDGVEEYLKYLKELGYKVEITNVKNREPYKGFHLYETNFKVSSNYITWTMFLSIEDEKYIEYELDIHLK